MTELRRRGVAGFRLEDVRLNCGRWEGVATLEVVKLGEEILRSSDGLDRALWTAATDGDRGVTEDRGVAARERGVLYVVCDGEGE